MEILRQIKYKPARVAGGYTDRILRVDLGSGEINIEKLAPDFKDKYTGGRGYALKLIWDGTTGETRYDSPENILVMASGPLGNEPGFPGTGKFIVGTISPMTDTFIDSNVGGHFGPLLKPGGIYISSELGYMAQNPILALVTPIIGNKKVMFPIPKHSDENIVLFKKLIVAGKFKGVIDRCYPLEEIVAAYKYVETGQKTGNVVITVEHNKD